MNRTETNNPNREPNAAMNGRAPESQVESALARLLNAVADRVESANNGRNSLDQPRAVVAQCAAPLDANALGLVMQEVISLREDIAELRRELPTMKAKHEELLSKREVAERLGVAPRTIDRMIDNGELPPGRWVGSRRRWTVAEIEEAAR